MKFSTTLFAALLPLLSLAAPTPEAEANVEERQTLTCPSNSGGGCGVYTVSGLGARKKAVIAAGGTSLDLAIAMMETEGMNTNYAYGDNKSGDAANFGIFKQNWYMIRSTSSTFSGQTASQYNNGAALNSNLALDVTTRKNAQNYYGWDKWAGGHRNGQTGLNSPYTSDINLYKTGVLWTQSQINSNSAYLTDDTRYRAFLLPDYLIYS